MSYTSLMYLAFLAFVVLLYYLFPRKMQKYVLFVFSAVFYAGFGVKAFGLLLVSALIAFFGAIVIDRTYKYKKYILILTIVLEVFILVALKYAITLRESLKLIVPVGISFYTLSVVGYVIDVFRGKYRSEKNGLNFLLYVLYFPHIMQGPIGRYDQFNIGKNYQGGVAFDYDRFVRGMQLMVWGYIKKLIIADRAAIFVNAVYGNLRFESGTVIFLASLLYSIQIYMDFSGCVDIVLGTSELFGIELTKNFKQPYLAISINDFWRRWHISLSSWFRDYVYIPLGGNRKGKIRRWINVMIVFIISGFWHGVGLSFVVWGALHGVYQIIGAVFEPYKEWLCNSMKINRDRFAFKLSKIAITFLLVNFAWVFFRLTEIGDALYAVKEIFVDISPWSLTDGTLLNYGITAKQWQVLIGFICIAFIVDMLHERNVRIRDVIGNQPLVIRWGIYLASIAAIILWGAYGIGYDAQSFIYMNF